MSASPPFFIQISDANGVVVRTHAGGKHEAELIDLFTTAIIAKGVGFFCSEAHVKQDIKDGVAEAIHSMKIKNPFDVV